MNTEKYLYDAKNSLLTPTELAFYNAISKTLPDKYKLIPQQNLAAFILKTVNNHYVNELFRNVDFLIVDENWKPMIAVEINDNSHNEYNRKKRDDKVRKILEEAGIPLVTFWTNYGVNQEYIDKTIKENFAKIPVPRKHNFELEKPQKPERVKEQQTKPTTQKGCYIATCVYNSYDCPEVWVLRRFRDNVLNQNVLGKLFIKIYYFISPKIVKSFGKNKNFRHVTKKLLDKLVHKLKIKGFSDDKYID